METRQGPSDPDEETQEAPSDSEEETKHIAGLAAGSTDLEGPVGPVRRKITISGNHPPYNANAHLLESTSARTRERSSTAKLPSDERGR